VLVEVTGVIGVIVRVGWRYGMVLVVFVGGFLEIGAG
jgi:hypothetical protein